MDKQLDAIAKQLRECGAAINGIIALIASHEIITYHECQALGDMIGRRLAGLEKELTTTIHLFKGKNDVIRNLQSEIRHARKELAGIIAPAEREPAAIEPRHH